MNGRNTLFCIAHWICRPNYPCVNIVHSERLQAQMVWNCQCPGRRVHLLSWSVAPPTGFVLPCCLNLPPVPLRKMVGRYAVSLFLLDFHSTSNLYLTSFPFFACLFQEHFVQFVCLLLMWHKTRRSSLHSFDPNVSSWIVTFVSLSLNLEFVLLPSYCVALVSR